jgi:hypothetical protein
MKFICTKEMNLLKNMPHKKTYGWQEKPAADENVIIYMSIA